MGQIVECHSDYAYAEKPVALEWEGQRQAIIQILAEWRTPGGKHFRVMTNNCQLFELIYEEAADEWQIQIISGG
jgi:hypothetical protein